MYSIGEFSKINRITPKALRHYDRIGLLTPASVDDWTGYRYYSPDQLPLIRKIIMLKDLGFSLKEIRDMIENDERTAQLFGRQAERLEEAVRKNRERLERVRAYLETLEEEDRMKSEVTIKALPEVMVASMRTVVPNYGTFFDIVPKMGDYMRSVGAICREPAYCFTIYHSREYREADIDVEICEAVTAPCMESDKVKFKTIGAVPEAACLMHRGPYSTLRETYNLLFRWIDDEGYEPADNARESYIDGIWNREDPEDWLTEVQVPIKRPE